MARLPIGVGTNPNDDTGDELRVAMTKVNDMMEDDIYRAASNLLYVDANAPTGGNGSLNSPFRVIQDAIDQQTGTNALRIEIEPGNYSGENLNFNDGIHLYCRQNFGATVATMTHSGTFDLGYDITGMHANNRMVSQNPAGANVARVINLTGCIFGTIPSPSLVILESVGIDSGTRTVLNECRFLGGLVCRGGDVIINSCQLAGARIDLGNRTNQLHGGCRFIITNSNFSTTTGGLTFENSQVDGSPNVCDFSIFNTDMRGLNSVATSAGTDPITVSSDSSSMTDDINALADVTVSFHDDSRYMAYDPTGTIIPAAVTNVEGAISQLSTSTAVLFAASTIDQNPTGLDVTTQISFGAAQGGGGDPVMIDAAGTVTFNQAMNTDEQVILSFGRVGAVGVSRLYFRAVINGTPTAPILYEMDDADDQRSAVFPFHGQHAIGDTLSFDMVRDSGSGGNDSGGLIAAAIPVAAGWTDQPFSAQCIIERRG